MRKSSGLVPSTGSDPNRLIARISHEIRTPLTAIIGMSEALYYKVGNDIDKKIVRSIVSNSKMLLSLVNDVLEMSRIDAGKLMICRDKVDIAGLLDEIELVFHDIAAKKNLSLFVERSISLPSFLKLDERRVKQILFNLVSNAIVFTRWGHIKVSADFITFEGNTGRLILRVADTGPGIPGDKLSSVFDEYFQHEERKFYEEGSTGLGLALSKKLAEVMGGTIKAESSEGKGTVFTLILPADEIIENKIEFSQSPTDFSEIEFTDSAILVVDDNQNGIEMIDQHIDGTGLRVYAANNIETALEKLRNHRINLIIMDLHMPNISGDEMAKMLRTRKDVRNIPIVSYTSASISDGSFRELECFEDQLFKPVMRNSLFALLTRYLKYDLR